MSANRKIRRSMARSSSGPALPDVSGLQQSLDKLQGLAAAPQLLLQIKQQMEMATQMAADLSDEYHRLQKKTEVLEGLVTAALTTAGYTEDMIQDLKTELEGGL